MESGRVFLVDDDSDDRYLFGKALQKIGVDLPFEYACDGVEALQKLQQSEIAAIIFTDLNMPKMNGVEFLQKLKQIDALKDIPVIAYSTSSNKADITRMLDAGAEHYMVKQGSFQVFCDELKAALSRFMDL